MKRQIINSLIALVIVITPGLGAADSILGEWISVERTKGGLGEAKTYEKDGTVHATFGALVDFKYKRTGDKLRLSFPGADDIVQKMEIRGSKMILTDKAGNKQELTHIDGHAKAGIIGKWTGDHYTGQKQILHFTASKNCYLAVPMLSAKGTYQIKGDMLIESFDGKGKTDMKWAIHDSLLILTDAAQGETKKYKRKK
jgi:hypothetical protein